MSPRLALHLLGPPQVQLDEALVLIDRRSGLALLAYLAVEACQRSGQRLSREFLSGLLWPEIDQDKAYTNLRHTLWELHQSLGRGWITAGRTAVEIKSEADIDLDVVRFQELVAQSRQQPVISRRSAILAEAASLYRNHFLTGFSLREASEFNEWVYAQSENYRSQILEVLRMLVEDGCALGQAETVIPHARRLVAFDPLNEAVHRLLMQVYLQAGQPSAALQQYQSCEKILRRELGLDPQPETHQLYKRIRKGASSQAPVPQKTIPKIPKHNLLVQLTSFIGREKECTQVCELLAGQRLVTLTGTGGIGKTRLALQVGEKLLGGFPDGAWFLALDALSQPDQIPNALAALFRIRPVPERSNIEQLLDVLGRRILLLILDNCEHLRDASVRLIGTLLAGCPHLKILTTSREVLGVDGETIYTVPSLSLPEELQVMPLEKKVPEFEALRLFHERAGLVMQAFKLSPENTGIVTAICRCLDGIPLAIELAAARLDILQPHEILEQLRASFALLVQRGHAAVPRHQSMRASMDWSWGLLAEEERVFLRRLSVFVGGWTLEAAQQVCEGQAVQILVALAAKSLIVVQKVEGQATRYRLHEIIRQYAAEKLSQANEADLLRERHLQYYLSLAGQAEIALVGPASAEWMVQLNREDGNLHAALAWAEKTNMQAELNIINCLKTYWSRYDLRESYRLLDMLLNKPAVQAYPAERARALCTQSGFLQLLEQDDAARSASLAGLKLARLCGDKRIEIDNLVDLTYLSGPVEHNEFGQRALNLARALKDPRREALTLAALAWKDRENYSRARLNWEKAFNLFRLLGDTSNLMVNLVDYGYIQFSYGDYGSAQSTFDEALRISQESDFPDYRPAALFSRGIIAMMNGDLDQAHTCLQEAADLTEATGNRRDTFFQRTRLGHLAVRQGALPEAHALFGQTAREFLMDRSEIGLVYTFEGIAALSVTVGRYAIAAGLIGWADDVRRKINDRRPDLEQADIDRLISACVLKMGEEAFADTYDAGQTMSMDGAVTFALESNESVQIN